MKIGGSFIQRAGAQRYAAQKAAQSESPSQDLALVAQEANLAAATPAKQTVFSFKLGNFSVELETEQPAIDPQALAALALERFQRAQASSFQSEMEIEQLRATLATPPDALSDASEQTPDAAQDPRSAAKAYAKVNHALRATSVRPGILIAVA